MSKAKALQALEESKKVPPQTPVTIRRGMTVRRTVGGIPVIRHHYSADRSRDPEINPAWKETERKTYTSQASWDREQEIIDNAGGGELVLADTLITYWNKIVITDPLWRPDPNWAVEAGFDHGKTNATAFERGYLDYDGVIILCGEYYQPGMEIFEHAPVLKHMADIRKVRAAYADPSIFPEVLQQSQLPGKPAERAKSINELYIEQGIELFSPFVGDRSDVSAAARVMAHWRDLDKREPTLKIVCRNYSERPQPGLHNWDCPNLLWELMRLRREKLTAQQLLSRNVSEAIVQKDNHGWDACFVAGTMVTSRGGSVPIENIRAGDEVLTRCGWRKVTDAGMTSRRAEIWKVGLTNGREIFVTGNHPIWVDGGFLRADALKYGMMCICLKESTERQISSTGWGSTSIATPIAQSSTSDPTIATEVSICTRWFGYLIIASQFLRSTTFTMLTAIVSTMHRRTCSQWTRLSTCSCAAGGSVVNLNLLISLPSATKQERGIHPKRDKHGTSRTDESLGLKIAEVSSWQRRKSAFSAALNFPTKERQRVTRSVLATVVPDGDTTSSLTTKPGSANCAEPISAASDTTRQDFAREYARVASVEKTHLRLPVYNVSVEGVPEYFANGILVHNCKYFVMSHPEPSYKTAQQLATEAVRPLVEQGDLNSAVIRYGQMIAQSAIQNQPARIGRRR